MPTFQRTPGKRILFFTKDPELIRKQLSGEITLSIRDVRPEDLLDDINTDAIAPAWACFDFRPEQIARNAYAGLLAGGKRLFPEGALADGDFEIVVSGQRKGVGSSREQAVQAEKFAGIRMVVAASFAPIYARNCVNLGVLMAGYEILARLEAGEAVPLSDLTRDHDPVTRLIVEHGGLFPFSRALAEGRLRLPETGTGPRPMTMAEKILGAHLMNGPGWVQPGDAVVVRADCGYSHEFTTAQVHTFLSSEHGEDYRVANPEKFAVFEDHLIYATGVPAMARFSAQIDALREIQRTFQKKTGVRDYNARDGKSPGICHQVAREQLIDPGDFVQATDSHTTMAGGNNALGWGVGATEYAALLASGLTFVRVPQSIRFELTGKLEHNVTAKDVMLYILCTFAKREDTLDRVIEYGGPGLASLSPDERATLANMATECSARSGIVEADPALFRWIAERRPGVDEGALRARAVAPDPGARYDGGVHEIDLGAIRPMVATPGDPDRGVPSDPTNGAFVEEIGHVPIDIAYAGSCTAGKDEDIEFYTRVLREAAEAGRRVAPGVQFYLQFASADVERYARRRGYLAIYEKVGVKVIPPGCGACIGCGPGVSESPHQVTVSAINRNYRGRSGPGRLYLASPLTVAASAIEGRIVAYREGMFR
jgi:3-isopropylmalate/(R)-2-methylmalate dehydratase large subunit